MLNRSWFYSCCAVSLTALIVTLPPAFSDGIRNTYIAVSAQIADGVVTVVKLGGLGTGVGTALGVNVGSAGAPVLNGGALGSPSSAGTLPAYTLGGTISGGGNQLNNIIIGTTTPLAASFTTIGASGTITANSTVNFVKAAGGQFQWVNEGGNTYNVLHSRNNADSAYLPLVMRALSFTLDVGTVSVPALANAATTSALCFNTGSGLLTYNSTVGTCTVSLLSAKNLKERLSPKDGLAMVLAAEPWRYDMKPDLPTYTEGEQIGFVAEYTKDQRLVARNADGTVGGFKYEQYTAALTAAIQAHKADNDNLMRRIETLEARKGL